jgi:hypothetical protein
MNYKQCRLVRFPDRDHVTADSGSIGPVGVYTCWLPEEFAHVGHILDLKRGDDTWTTGWVVDEVYSSMSEQYVREHERDYRTQSQASDKFTPNTGLFKKP